MRYYRLLDDVEMPRRWFLSEVNFDAWGDMWNYMNGSRVKDHKYDLTVEVRRKGLALGFTFAAFGLPIVDEDVAQLFSPKEAQLIPVDLSLPVSGKSYYICVLLNLVECLDEDR